MVFIEIIHEDKAFTRGEHLSESDVNSKKYGNPHYVTASLLSNSSILCNLPTFCNSPILCNLTKFCNSSILSNLVNVI